MAQQFRIEFVLRDKVEGVEITPQTIDMARFNEFNKEAETFIQGSHRLETSGVLLEIGPGSYILTAFLPFFLCSQLEPDLKALQKEDSLGEIDPKRAEIVKKWQNRSKGEEHLRYVIRSPEIEAEPIEVSNETDFRIGEFDPWIRVERYLLGKVETMGGSKKAKLLVRLASTGQTVRVSSNHRELAAQNKNHVYHDVLLYVEAEEHVHAGTLRNVRLISFEDYDPRYNEEALTQFVNEGLAAWKDVTDPAEWVRKLRDDR